MAVWTVYLAFRTVWELSDERWGEFVVGATSDAGQAGATASWK